jgi:DNA-binding response OmpR family regulator
MPQSESFNWTDLPARPRLATRPRVLVVDDEADLLALLRESLSMLGFDVDCARTPGEAMTRAVRSPPDLILLDILLPGCDGLDMLEALRDEPETCCVPVLACTALGQRESGPLLLDAGFDGLVTKPVDVSQLVVQMAEALRRRA